MSEILGFFWECRKCSAVHFLVEEGEGPNVCAVCDTVQTYDKCRACGYENIYPDAACGGCGVKAIEIHNERMENYGI
jgi:rubrerythrin